VPKGYGRDYTCEGWSEERATHPEWQEVGMDGILGPGCLSHAPHYDLLAKTGLNNQDTVLTCGTNLGIRRVVSPGDL
jgi:hypothetical protein